MRLDIQDVKACKNKAMGNYIIRGKELATIRISLKLNKMLHDYMLTMLHELLHAWFTLVRVKGFKCTNNIEHKIIYEIEDKVFKVLKRYYKNGKRI